MVHLTMGGRVLLYWYIKDPSDGPTMNANVIDAVRREISLERFSAVVHSLTIAVDMVMVC